MLTETKQRRSGTTIPSRYSPEEVGSFVRSQPASRHAAPGAVVAGRYILDRKLGAGGMGSVWLAYDQSLQGFCALKVLHQDESLDDERRIRFRREATVAARIPSENVVSILEHGEWEGQPYIAMEYVEGEDLLSRLNRTGKLDVCGTCQLVLQLARGLGRAHARGIVHRDIKPANVLLGHENGDEVAKLVDFGVAKDSTYSLKDGLTQVGAFLGTPDYASPEQLRGRDVDARSDLWSLGVLAFECLTGGRPFEDDSLAGTCAKILRGPIPSLRASDPSLPPTLDAWWHRAMARDPNQRYQSAKEFAEAFAEAVGRAPVSALSSSPQVEAHAATQATSGSRSGLRRLGWVALALVCLLFAIVALPQKPGPSTDNAPAVGRGLLASGSELPFATSNSVVLAPEAADGLLRYIRRSAKAAVGVTAVGPNEVPPGIQLRCDVLSARATDHLAGAPERVSMR